MFDPLHIAQHDALYPSALCSYLAARAPMTITARGNLDILLGRGTARRAPTLALRVVLNTCACLPTGKLLSREIVCCCFRLLPNYSAVRPLAALGHVMNLLRRLPMSCLLLMLLLAAKLNSSAIPCALGGSLYWLCRTTRMFIFLPLGLVLSGLMLLRLSTFLWESRKKKTWQQSIPLHGKMAPSWSLAFWL